MANQALIVFVKEPIAGQVKTRLCPPLKPEESAKLYTAFLKDSFQVYNQLQQTDIIYFHANGNTILQSILPQQSLWETQADGDLGDKMNDAFQRCLKIYKKCVIVGSDHPDLPLTYLKKAFDVLDYVDVTVGPSNDGGYYCIGLKKPQPTLFTDMNWSTPDVYPETTKRLSENQLELFELPEWYDIDDKNDLELFLKKNNDLSKFPTIKTVLDSIIK